MYQIDGNVSTPPFNKTVEIEYEPPNPFLYEFNGNLNLNGKKHNLDEKNMVLRGSSLRNTRYLYGMVLYAGHDSKVMKNSFSARAKKSRIEVEMG